MLNKNKTTARTLIIATSMSMFLSACSPYTASQTQQKVDYQKWQDVHLDSLADMSIEALRQRDYASNLEVVHQLGQNDSDRAYQLHFSADGTLPYSSYVLAYFSDGNRVYSRVDIPATPPPATGYPIVIFVHGWVGIEAAPDYNFSYTPDTSSASVIDQFVDAGYLVLSPALRGHGTVNGIPAEGIKFLQAWDNSSYISPMFYAIDVLNLMEGIGDLETLDWSGYQQPEPATLSVNKEKIHVMGHSQGADAALAVLAISGEGSSIKNPASSGSLWSGCFGPRFEQAAIYGPMSTTLEAFMSGDGNWTGTAVGNNGAVNPNFVFAWPPDWIGTVDTHSAEWTWQAQSWSVASVNQALQIKFTDMYDALNRGVADFGDVSFSINEDITVKAEITHDTRVERSMQKIGGFAYHEYLTEPLLLHHSDQDYYSPPDWNSDLAGRINQAGGQSWDFTYKGNTHSLGVSKHAWFSAADVTAGLDTMVARDSALIEGRNPQNISSPQDQ